MKTKQYAAHPLTTTQSELPSAILSALTIALLSALLFTSCSKHHYLELLLDPRRRTHRKPRPNFTQRPRRRQPSATRHPHRSRP